ncbi:MAG TPA: chromosome segregation ATPase [Coleofasciculaceae cyanobacterium]
MTRNREIPDSWPASNSAQPNQFKGSKRTRRASDAELPLVNPALGAPSQRSPSGHRVPPEVVTSEVPSSSIGGLEHKRRLNFGLRFWAILIVLISSGVGFTAVALLLKLPAVPNCPATYWPTASASLRLYCAQLAANKQTADNLLKAISLVEDLPSDHPLRPEINRSIEQWSLDILKIGEEKFQAGQMGEAIKIAQAIPSKVAAAKLVDKQIDRWQRIWSKAQAIADKVEQELRKSNWTLAFREAVQLTNVENKYWATTKYDQITKLIQVARQASAQLDKARDLSKSDSVDDIVAAIKEAQKVPRASYAYTEAQKLIAESGKKLVKLAEYRLEQRNWQGMLEIANKIPDSVKLPEVKADLINLAQAIEMAVAGTSLDLERAIASAQKVGADRPLYEKAQQLVTRWQRETEDVTRLERARTFANSGLVADLKTAIAEAQQIPSGNPRYQEARTEIRKWTRQAETIEDQPYLDRASQLASFGGLPALQEAIQEASRIAPGRALYKQAQAKVGEWTDTIQRQQDQPYLDQARALASSGNLPAAINAAEQIKSGRALYKEAQNEISGWQMDIRGEERLQSAYQMANAGTADALSAAIRIAREVPSGSKSRGEARVVMNRWSDQILAMAQDRSSYDLTEAIAIANMIPSGTEAYEAAQQQIRSWQSSLEPPPSPSPIQTSTEIQ